MVRHTRGGVENEYACRPSEPTKSLYGCAGRAPRPRKPARRKNREARPVRIVFISLGRNSSGAEAPFYLRVYVGAEAPTPAGISGRGDGASLAPEGARG